ncbi:MAG TPA: PfkB family carbohydrate kinase [Geminicoccaceae bacterium]|nr:PfkB family carbohydrate kinase [Geminicoccaceae bacterium]
MTADADAAADRKAGAVCVFTPSPLCTVTVECHADGEPEIHFHAGGQGFWVARMITRLGAEAVLCAPLGGESGAVLRTLIELEGIAVRAVPSQGWNGGYVHDRRGGERRVVAETASPALTRHEVDDLYGAALAAGLAAGVAVLAGPQNPAVLPAETYRRLAHDLGDNGVAVVADLSGEALRAIEGGVRFLKVSHSELIEAGYAESDERRRLIAGAERLQRSSGAANVLVSCADQPALALLEGRLVEVQGPRFEALEHRGAGDSMTAGLAVGCARGLDSEAILRLAAAAGALNVTRHGLGSGARQNIEEVAERVEVREVAA